MAAKKTHRPKATKLVPYLSAEFTPLAVFGSGMALLTKAVHDVAVQLDGRQKWDKHLDAYFIDKGHRNFAVRWPEDLKPFFEPASDTEFLHQLRRENPGDMQLAEFLHKLVGDALDAWMQIDAFSNIENTPLVFFRNFYELIEPTANLSRKLKKFSASFVLPGRTSSSPLAQASAQGTQVNISFNQLNFESNSQKISVSNRNIILNRMDEFARSFAKWCQIMHGSNSDLKGLPGLSMSDGLAWYHRSVGLDQNKSAEVNYSGFFHIVREARGSVTNDPKDVNLLLRDMLWVRSFTDELDEVPLEDEEYRQIARSKSYGSPLGIYYSVLEQAIYEVKRLKVVGDVLIIEGLALFDDLNASKPLSLHLPKFDDAHLNFSMGTLSGATNERLRTGAWSVVGIRPNVDKDILREIDTVFSNYLDALSRMDRSQYNASVTGFGDYVRSMRLCGVLASQALTDCGEQERADLSRKMTEAFRAVFKTSRQHRVNCEATRDRILAECELPDQSTETLRAFDEGKLSERLLKLIEQQSSYAISPISVFKKDLSEPETQELTRVVEQLSDIDCDLFATYEEYKAWVKQC